MTQGTVKWYDESKGHGIIGADGDGIDVHVEFSAIEKEGYRSLTEGERVEFMIVSSPKGPKAERVQSI